MSASTNCGQDHLVRRAAPRQLFCENARPYYLTHSKRSVFPNIDVLLMLAIVRSEAS
jgi:hypothetical protein